MSHHHNRRADGPVIAPASARLADLEAGFEQAIGAAERALARDPQDPVAHALALLSLQRALALCGATIARMEPLQ